MFRSTEVNDAASFGLGTYREGLSCAPCTVATRSNPLGTVGGGVAGRLRSPLVPDDWGKGLGTCCAGHRPIVPVLRGACVSKGSFSIVISTSFKTNHATAWRWSGRDLR